MSILKKSIKALKRIVFRGDPILQRVFLGRQSPQKEISVWLHGTGEPLDVTYSHAMACAVPLTLCIPFDAKQGPRGNESKRLTLKFCEQNGKQRVLGEIELRLTHRIVMGGGKDIAIFQVHGSTNYCVPKLQLWAHYLLYGYSDWRNSKKISPDLLISSLEKRAMEVLFICPRPISLVSVISDIQGNMFPMNVMGDIDANYFAFALRDSKMPAHLVETSGRLALSSVPFEHGSFAYRLGVNHNKKAIDWYELPFETRKSKTFHVPVPEFAFRVREMEVEKIQRLGSHTLFIARIASDETYGQGTELFAVHGFYQAWQIKQNKGEWSAALAGDASIKS